MLSPKQQEIDGEACGLAGRDACLNVRPIFGFLQLPSPLRWIAWEGCLRVGSWADIQGKVSSVPAE